MFNLLMLGDDSEWQIETGKPETTDFPLSRFLEYTDKSIEQAFIPLNGDSLDRIGRMPAIFMSELQRVKDGDDYFRVRVGDISDVRVDGPNLIYTLVIRKDYGNCPVTDLHTWETALKLGKWEIHRSHWAIKDGELYGALSGLGLDVEYNLQADSGGLILHTPIISSPTLEVVQSPTITNVEDFISYVLRRETDESDEVFYRGHSDRTYQLVPTVLRKDERGEFLYRLQEDRLVRELLTAQPAEFESDRRMIDKLVRMQHYGLPTRLLDITSNPLVALYFACSDNEGGDGDIEVVGEVVIFRTKKAEVKFFDSDTVSCLANLAMLTQDERDDLELLSQSGEMKKLRAYERLLNEIRSEKPHFKDCIELRDLSKILFVRGRNTHGRIRQQSGAFLLFGNGAILEETGHSTLKVDRIAVQNKRHILSQLEKLNIRPSTIYPEIEKAAVEIARTYRHSNRSSSADAAMPPI